MTRRVRVALERLSAGERRIDGAEGRYLARVLRLRAGASLTAFDPVARNEADATLVAIERDHVLARFGEPRPASVVGLEQVTLVWCAGKGDKPDDVVRAATALGVSSIVVATSERSVARAPATPERHARLAAIALDAARQSGRGDLPSLEGPVELARALDDARANTALKLCLEPTASTELGAALRERRGRGLALLVGPEGGFAEDELELARDAGFTLVRFGSLVLRTELAAVAALGAVVASETNGPARGD
ncbi:MAG TPA: RsmE family RNA methyltransferase [Polyangiaceae bacterium]|nr:RsmE family RNA methyltransferase [Polyangiaceae bacterium]